MKKLFIIALTTLFAQAVVAQKLDRSQKPKPGPAPIITFTDPVIYTLPNGITILVVENHKLPQVSASFRIDAGPITEGKKAGVLGLMGSMLNEGTTTKTKAQFDEAVDLLGANVGLSASGGSTSALTRYFDSAFLLMAEAMRKPAFPQASFDKLKSQTITGLKSNERSAKAISGRVVPALTYGTNNPMGEFTTEEIVNSLTLADVKDAYTKYVTPSRGYLTFVGDIKPEAAKALAIKALGDWKGTMLTLPVIAKAANPAKTEVDIINLSNAVQSEITVINLIDLPLSSPDYHAVLLANQILGGGSDAKLFRNLREKHGFTYGAYATTDAGRFQETFSANAAVRNEKVDSAVVEFLHEINVMRTEKVSTEDLQNAKNLYNGSFALGLENPARTAAFASNILINKLPKDFYTTYLQKINAVTPEDIQRVSQKYFGHDNTRVIIVGKKEAFAAGLSKLGFTIKDYDAFAAPVKATAASTATAKTAQEILSKYITAVGGAAELKKVTSIVSTGDFEIQGQKLALTVKQMAPNMESTEISMGGNVVMKDAFNGTAGSKSQGPNKMVYSPEEVKDKKDRTGLFEQLNYGTTTKVEPAGVAKVGTADAYKLIVTSPSGKMHTEYYDVNSGLLLKEENTQKQGGMDITTSTEYSDYRKTGTVLIPYKIAQSVQTPQGNQDFVMMIKEVKVNTPLTVADFN